MAVAGPWSHGVHGARSPPRYWYRRAHTTPFRSDSTISPESRLTRWRHCRGPSVKTTLRTSWGSFPVARLQDRTKCRMRCSGTLRNLSGELCWMESMRSLRSKPPRPPLGLGDRYASCSRRVTSSTRPAIGPCAYRTACTSSCRRSSRIAYTASRNGTTCWTPHRRGFVGCTPRSARCSPCTGLLSKRQIRGRSCG